MCLLKMREAMMHELILFLLASQVLHIFGKMTILRGTAIINNSQRRKLMCLSEDDDSALVWNEYLSLKHYRQGDMEFQSLNRFNNNEIDCKMNADESCLKSWSKQGWSLTNSLKTPMGPVFDQRWEDFKLYENIEDRYESTDITAPAAALPFSVRALHDAQILLCKGKNYNRDFCYWIIIGGWGNMQSVIRKCTTGVPLPGKWPVKSDSCQKDLVPFMHSEWYKPLATNKWQSFVITWDSRTISVYDTDKIIMTYTDTEVRRGDYHVFIRSDEMMLFRFHIYNFLHTTLESAILTSSIFHFNNGSICIKLLIGLCEKCDAQITLRDSTNDEVLEMVIANGSSTAAIHGLPMWQPITIQKKFSTISYNSVIIQLIPILNTPTSNPLWAIANVRQCPPNGSLRFGVTYSESEWIDGDGYFWPPVICQKLFYYEHSIVTAVSLARPNIELDDANCPQGKIGPQCLFSCKDDLDSDADCKRTLICNKYGCTCPPGFLISGCMTPCRLNTYGHECKRNCGSCLNNIKSSESPCNTITGACRNGCDNTKKVYIPPLCQISIDKLDPPAITSTTKTTIEAIVLMLWKDEYKETTIFYSFSIKDQRKYFVQQPWNRVFQNMTHLIGHFENLEPGTTYQISCSLSIAEAQVQSDWRSVETDCDAIKDFDVTSEETSITINWRNNTNQLYPCPVNQYHLIVQNKNANTQVTERVMYFPYKLLRLKSYTSFNVTILHRDRKLFSQEIRTLDGVPSRVLDLQSTLSSNKLTLTWKEPDQPNGKIVRYEILIKVKEYYGCKDLKLPTQDNYTIIKSTTDTAIIISDLHPYTSYSAQVIAHNSRHSSMSVEISFDTKRTEIPAEVFNQLTVQGWKLSWHPPEDCTTILGPIKARIKIHGISDAVRNFNVTRETLHDFLDLDKIEPQLNGVERYIATVYVIRDYSSPENDSAYQECEFETPPTAPPQVTNLNIVEIDTRQTPPMIYLRWQSPLPPINGKLSNYAIQSCNEYEKQCTFIEIHFNNFCDLWDDYICGSIRKSTSFQKIQVSAYNTNVTEQGAPTSVTEEMLSNTTPDAPGEYTFTIYNHSVVDLSWHHPWRTGSHLQFFHIRIVEMSSNLTESISRSPKVTIHEYPVTNYKRNYSERLYLFPSTQYYAYIQAVTIANTSSNIKYVEIRTPSTIAFDGDLEIQVHKSNSTVSLNVPSVLNDTHDSMMHIIMKGPNTCEQYSKVPENLRAQVGIKMNDVAWQAAEVPTSELAGKLFMVGDNRTYGSARNCPLNPEAAYEITIIVTGVSLPIELITFTTSFRINEVASNYHETWLTPVMLFFIVASVAILYLYRRRRQQLHENGMQQENMENYRHELMSMMSDSKQNLSTLSDRHILSREITPDVPLMADNKYLSAPLALVESSSSVSTTLPCDEMLPMRIKKLKKQLPIQQRRLQKIAWQDEAMRQSPSSLSDRNRAKNRFPELMSGNINRIYLKRYPVLDEDSDYLSAVYVDGIKLQNQYIATQLPLPSTINDFWRMIAEFKVELILMLQPPDLQDPTCCAIAPASGEFKPTSYLNITAKEIVELEYYTSQNLLLIDNSEKPSREQSVTILCLTDWKPGRNQPPPPVMTMVTFWQAAERIARGDSPTVTLCHDGVTGCGLYLALSFLLERMALERECDVCLAVQAIRRSRPDFVPSLEHLEYLSDAALTYFEYFETYANFS